MATITGNVRVLPAPAPIFSFFSRLVGLFERNTEVARIRTELNSMSDRELADLGLTAGDIDDVATGRYRKD